MKFPAIFSGFKGRDHSPADDRLDRWTDAEISADPTWIDSMGRTPTDLYRTYLIGRRSWEERAWKAGGSRSPKFPRLLDDLAALHAEVSVQAPVETRDMSMAKPPARDPSRVRVSGVERDGDTVIIRTAEDEFEDLLPIPYRVVVVRVGGRWFLKERSTGHGQGRPIQGL